jgi:hypothetical protein
VIVVEILLSLITVKFERSVNFVFTATLRLDLAVVVSKLRSAIPVESVEKLT